MKSETRSKALAGADASIDLRTSDVLVILQLLGAAQVSIRNRCGDEPCARLLEQCGAYLRERYGLAPAARSHDLVWSESSLTAVVHLLTYVQAEVAERLSDRRCASAVKQCIDHLLQTHLLSSDEFCD